MAGNPADALAARGSASKRAGGSASRARSGGSVLAQSYYTRAVKMGQQGNYEEAKTLLGRAVEKNPDNEKYRYFLSLLLFKVGDFGEAASRARGLQNASSERYRTKASALLARIDDYLRGNVSVGNPAGSGGIPSAHARDVLPPGAYVNIARSASEINAGGSPGASPKGPSMTSASYRDVKARVMAGQPAATPTRSPMEGGTAVASLARDAAAAAASATADASSDDWTSSDSWASPSAPAPAATASRKPVMAEITPADDFADVFEEVEGGESASGSPVVEEPAPPAPPAPIEDAFTEEAFETADSTTEAATEETGSFEEFDDSAFPDASEEPAAPPPASDGDTEFEEGGFSDDVFEDFN
jgi:hypothetical protein